MKILFVNDYSEKVGGTETYIRSLSEQLRKKGHEVSFFYGCDDFKRSLQIRNTFFSYLHRIFSFSQYRKFKQKMREVNPDIVHLHNIFNEVTPSILLATSNVPIIMTIHDYQIIQAVFNQEERSGKPCEKLVCPGCLNCVGLKGMIYEKIKRGIHKPLLSKLSLVIAPSKWCESVLKSANVPYKTVQIYNGLSLGKPFPFQYNSVALYSGRLTKDKGVQYFIDAVPLIIKEIPNFKAIIAGDGELKEELIKKVQKLGIQNSVIFLGRLSKEKIFEQYGKCSVVVVPSVWPENLPTVCIEALSAGRPVVATTVGGIPEIIIEGINGYMCPPKSSDSLAKLVVRILNNKTETRNLTRQAPKTVQKFDIVKHANEVTKNYTRLIS